MSYRKFTDDEVIKALECCNDNGSCDNCPFDGAHNEDDPWCVDELNEATRTLINRQKAEIEKLTYKLECLLCHATGNKLSKSTYSLRTMETVVTDYIQKSIDEAEGEARAEAIEEFAERLKAKERKMLDYDEAGFSCMASVIYTETIDNLVKEMTEGGEPRKDGGK